MAEENTEEMQSFNPALEKFSVEVVEGEVFLLRIRANRFWIANRMLFGAVEQGYIVENGHYAAIFSWEEREGVAEMVIRTGE